MPSSFKSLPLFTSGPHRFLTGKQGELYLPNYIAGGSGAGTTLLGLLELEITVSGRLVASSDPALQTLRSALTDQLAHPPIPGTLIDSRGNTHTNMSLLAIQWDDRTDRNSKTSIAYKAIFKQLS